MVTLSAKDIGVRRKGNPGSTDHGVPTGTVIEKSTYVKDCKVTHKFFAHSADEDGEHWLEALDVVQKELEPE